jgi:hypothetical protein
VQLTTLFLTEAVESCSESPTAPNTVNPKESTHGAEGLRYYPPPELPPLL